MVWKVYPEGWWSPYCGQSLFCNVNDLVGVTSNAVRMIDASVERQLRQGSTSTQRSPVDEVLLESRTRTSFIIQTHLAWLPELLL